MAGIGSVGPDPPYEGIPARAVPGTWLVVLLHGALGAVSVGFAVNADFAAGRVAFASDVWRVVLGAVGAFVLFLAARGLYRKLTDYVAKLTPADVARARRNGVILLVAGGWFLACRMSDPVARESMVLRSWAQPFYAAGGAYLVLVGLVQQLNPTPYIRRARVMRGQGVPGRATILRADEPEQSDDGGYFPVTVDFEIDAGNRVYQASGKFTLDPPAVEMLVPGAMVDVVVDPADPEIFHVDWKTWRRPL